MPQLHPNSRAEDSGATLSLSADPCCVSRRIGPYRLLHILGEGGMGEVWLAEQETPIHRKVALKVIKAGMDTRAVVARFESERQALALMDHPNIARVFDAGATPEGRPYFVMEYVPGLPLTEYCDKHRLTVKARLELFTTVCDGVQHAHQKAVIHRDLKPSNVLVVESGDKPVPKIIDFGLAKATVQRLTDKTMVTELGMMLGTPEYMSPEQADQREQNIDTRTDVYSLGVILYELLVGVLPFDVKALRTAGLEAVLRVIREQEPVRPSTRIRSMGADSTAAAQRRKEEPRGFARHLRGELDWITMKALEKDRSRRYGSPAELAADIDRHLHDQAVVAGSPSATYRAAKFVSRHRFAVATVSSAAILLIVFAAAMAVQLRRVTRERDRADRITQFMIDMFKISRPGEARGNSVTAREVLDKASRDIDSGLHRDPELQARLMATMAATYYHLGLYSDARKLYEQAVDIQRRVLGSSHPDTLSSQHQLAWILLERGHDGQARVLLQQVVENQRRVLGPENPKTLASMNSLGVALQRQGSYLESEDLLRHTAATQRRVLGSENSSTMSCLDNLSLTLIHEGKYAEAETLERENLETRRRVLGPEHLDTLFSMRNLAFTLQSQGKYAEAETLQRQTLDIRRRLLGPDHPQTLVTTQELATTLQMEGKYADAEPLYQQVLDSRRRTAGPQSPAALISQEYLAIDLSYQQRYAEAEKLFREAIKSAAKLGQPDALSLAWYNFACGAAAAGRHEDALQYLARAIDLGYKNPEEISADADLKSLHSDPRFAALIAKARQTPAVPTTSAKAG